MITFARFEIVRTLRNVKFLAFLLAMPVGLYLVLTSVEAGDPASGNPQDVYLLTMIMMAVYAAIGSAMYATGPELAQERASGWVRQLLVTPLTFSQWMGAKVVQALVLTLPGTIAVGLVATLVHGVHLAPQRWVLLVLAVVLGSIPFGLLGQIIGQVFNNQAASAAQLFVLFGLSFLGGVLLPMQALPPSVQQIGAFTPTYHLVEMAKEIVTGAPIALAHPVVILVSAAVIGAVVLGLWRRDGATGN